jgi:hypothetical protein
MNVAKNQAICGSVFRVIKSWQCAFLFGRRIQDPATARKGPGCGPDAALSRTSRGRLAGQAD